MKISEISSQTLKDIAKTELLSLHLRLHQLWGSLDKDAPSKEMVFNAHQFIAREMEKRGIKHTGKYKLEKMNQLQNQFTESLAKIEDLVIIPDFISLTGSAVALEESEDLDIVWRAEFTEDGKVIFPLKEMLMKFMRAFPKELQDKMHHFGNPSGPTWSFMPITDLVMRFKLPKIVELDESYAYHKMVIQKGIRQLFGVPGGKKDLARTLVKLLPEHKTYAEICAGGAAVLFAKEPSEKEILSDISDDIIFAYKFAKKITDEQIKEFQGRKWVANETHFYKLRDAKQPASQMDRFYRWMYLKHFSYGGGKLSIDKWNFSQGSQNRVSFVARRLPIIRERLKDVVILKADYRTAIKKYDSLDTLFYIDPPYFGEEMDGTAIDPEPFYEAVKKIKGKWLVSLNDTKENRETFKDFNICKIHLNRRFHSGGSGKDTTRSSELLISNFKLPKTIRKAGNR